MKVKYRTAQKRSTADAREARQRSISLETLEIEHKQTEKALVESEEKFLRMLESVTDGITITDLNWVIAEANERSAEIHGLRSKNELLGKSAFEFIASRDHEKANSNMQRTLVQGSVKGIGYTLLRADGAEFPGELSSSLLRDAYGNPVGFIAVTRDITEHKHIEEALRVSEEKCRLLVEHFAKMMQARSEKKPKIRPRFQHGPRQQLDKPDESRKDLKRAGERLGDHKKRLGQDKKKLDGGRNKSEEARALLGGQKRGFQGGKPKRTKTVHATKAPEKASGHAAEQVQVPNERINRGVGNLAKRSAIRPWILYLIFVGFAVALSIATYVRFFGSGTDLQAQLLAATSIEQLGDIRQEFERLYGSGDMRQADYLRLYEIYSSQYVLLTGGAYSGASANPAATPAP